MPATLICLVFTLLILPDRLQANLSPSCPEGQWVSEGYILIGTEATCLCYIANDGSPPGKVQWFNSKGEKLGTAGTSVTLLIPSQQKDRKEIYTCKSFSWNGTDGKDIVFVPSFWDLPSARLSPSCPEGKGVRNSYIEIGTHATCKCQISSFGSMSVQAQWFNSEGEKLGRSGIVATLTIPSGLKDQNKTYTCKAIVQNGLTGPSKDFVPVFIYPLVVRLSSSCPNGKWAKNVYIRIGTKATCECNMSHIGPLRELVQWFTSDGKELGPPGTNVTLSIPTDPSDVGKEYTCQITARPKQPQLYVVMAPKLVGPTVEFKVNNKSSLVVQQGSNMTFSCEVESIFPAVAVLVGPGHGQIQELRSQNQILEFHLNNVTCEDLGRYECRGDDGVEFQTPGSKQFVDVYIKCALKTKGTKDKFYFEQHEKFIIHVETEGYPEPTNYSLAVKQSLGWTEISQGKYKINFIVTQFPCGMLSIEITGHDSEEPTMYNLNVQNGVGTGMDFKFIIYTVISKAHAGSDYWMEIGVGVGSCTAIIIVAVFCCKKQNISQTCTSRTLSSPAKSGEKDIALKLRPLPEIPVKPINEPASPYDEITYVPGVDYIDAIDPPYYLDPIDPLNPRYINPDGEQTNTDQPSE